MRRSACKVFTCAAYSLSVPLQMIAWQDSLLLLRPEQHVLTSHVSRQTLFKVNLTAAVLYVSAWGHCLSGLTANPLTPPCTHVQSVCVHSQPTAACCAQDCVLDQVRQAGRHFCGGHSEEL